MDLREKAQRANEVFKKTKNGFISCEYRKNDESLIYSFLDKNSANSFLLEQQMNFEGNLEIVIIINPNNNTQVIETHKKEVNEKTKDESNFEITQEIIDNYAATNEEFWDAFYNGSQNASYSVFKDLKIDSKEDLIDLINADKSMISILNKLFKHALSKGEFFVAYAEEKLILTNYRLIVLGASDLNIPLSKISIYGAEGNFFVVKYLKNGEEKSVTLSHYIDEILVNSVIEAKEFKDLDSKQNAIIESTFSTNTVLNKPNYEIPSISQKMKSKMNTFKFWGTIFLLPQLIGLWGLPWLYDMNITDFSKSLASIIIIGMTIRWIGFIFKNNSFIGKWFVIFSISIPILSVFWFIHSISAVPSHLVSEAYSIGFFITLISSIIFVFLTFKLNK